MAWKKFWAIKRFLTTCALNLFSPVVESLGRRRARSHLGLCRLAHVPGGPP